MTTPEALLELADRVEREEPSRELDAEVLVACGHQAFNRGPRMGWEYRLNGVGLWRSMPSPTTSLDAAVTLVPEGMVAAAIHYVPQLDPKMPASGVARVYSDDLESGRCTGRTAAAALTAAALRATAADMQARIQSPKVRSPE